MITANNVPFTDAVRKFVRSSFTYLEEDVDGNKRIFFENAGGSLRLREVVEEDARIAAIPDCLERKHLLATELRDVLKTGISDIRLFLNAKDGSIFTSISASKAMFEIIGTIAENTSGTNIVTTSIEHPSSYDACAMYAEKEKKELRVARANPYTGGVDVEKITSLVDKETSLLSVILTSNISGAVLDIQNIVKKVREINPEIFIVVDAVQAAPHGLMDVEQLQVDGLNIAPYKMFGNRGMAFGYISDRVAKMPHHRLLATEEENWSIGSPAPAHYSGFSKVIDYICKVGSFYSDSNDRRQLIEVGMGKIHEQEQALLKRLIFGSNNTPGLRDIDGVNLYFDKQPLEEKDLIVAISFDTLSCSEAVEKYGQHNILVYDRVDTNFYSKRILNSLNVKEVVRISPLHCHSFEDIDKFLYVTQRLASN